MNDQEITLVPTNQIRIMNPRNRNYVAWQAIVASIRSVGLKKPITLSRRESPDSEGFLYELVCGQGRLEAFREIGETSIPAVFCDAPLQERHLMSLVENIARRPPSNGSLFREVQVLVARGYDSTVIGENLGLQKTYVHGLLHLVKNGEERLLRDVEAGKLPITVAIEIANGNDSAVQAALAAGYESGEFRGSKLKAVRRLIAERKSKKEWKEQTPRTDVALTAPSLIRLYKDRIREQQRLVTRANETKERLLVIVSAMRSLLADEDFRTTLKAEGLLDMPASLSTQLEQPIA